MNILKRLKIKQRHINVDKTDINVSFCLLQFNWVLMVYCLRLILISERKLETMFNNIWNALSNSVWPFTVAVFNLWAICKVGGFFISIIIRVIADSYHDMHPLD